MHYLSLLHRLLTLLGHMANEVRGQQAPGSPFLIYSDEKEDLKQWESHGQEIPGRFPPWTTKSVHVAPGLSGSTTWLSTGKNSNSLTLTQLRNMKANKQIIKVWLLHPFMNFYLCLHMEEGSGASENTRCNHWCIPHYWLWDLAQSERIPLHLNTSVTEFKGWV